MEQFNNRRGKDPFLCFFSLHLKLFNLSKKNLMGLIRRRAMKTQEIVWAVHCDNRDVLLDMCFPPA